MTTILKLKCLECSHYKGSNRCIAFPEGIPEEIIYGKNKHSKPIKGQDNEIVFEKK